MVGIPDLSREKDVSYCEKCSLKNIPPLRDLIMDLKY
jgi:hypothetical protein